MNSMNKFIMAKIFIISNIIFILKIFLPITNTPDTYQKSLLFSHKNSPNTMVTPVTMEEYKSN